MNILVINWQDITHPLGGGAEVHLHQIFSRIAHKGHRVTLLCSAFPGAPSEEMLDGIRVIRRGGRYLFNFRAAFVYLTRLRRKDFDVVVDDLNKIPFFTPLYVRRPLFGIAHHLFDKSIFLETNPALAAYVYLMERLALAVYRRFQTPFMIVSPSTQEEFLRKGFTRDRLPVVYNCVDHSVYKPTGVPKSSVPFVGCFGRLKKYKSVDHFLLAFKQVLEQVPEARGIVVGDGDDRPRLERLSEELGLKGRMEFTGFVPEDRKVELLQQMWVKVAPSSKEGWGLTVIEANACGTPVIASNVPGLRDSIRDGETGLLYPYGDVAALREKILMVLQDAPLRERLSAASLQWAGKFDWDTAAETVLELLAKRITSSSTS